MLVPLTTTDAVRLPAFGFVVNATVSVVAVAAVTAPMAPLLKTTVLFPGVVSKPKPLMTSVSAVASRSVVLAVMTGETVATWMLASPAIEFAVTVAVTLPRLVGLVVNVTVNCVGLADVTLPAAPLLNVTRLVAIVEPKPKPLITMIDAVIPSSAVLLVTAGLTVAT